MCALDVTGTEILFRKEPAERLNQAIQTYVAPHLYLLVDYDPGTDLVGEADTFTRAGLNLYRFIVDAGILCQIPKILKNDRTFARPVARLRNIKEEAETLRTYLAHNSSMQNDAKHTIESMRAWLRTAIQKESIEDEEDRRKACARVAKQAEVAYRAAMDIVVLPAAQEKREEYQQKLEQEMCLYYTHTTGKSIVEGKMKQIGISTAKAQKRVKLAKKSPYECAGEMAYYLQDWVRDWEKKHPGKVKRPAKSKSFLLGFQETLAEAMYSANKPNQVKTFLPRDSGILYRLIDEAWNKVIRKAKAKGW